MIVLYGEGAGSSEEGTDSQAENSEPDDEEDDPVKAQDFHTMLSVILESFVDLQRTGFIWDLVYEGVLYKNVEFVIFVPFVKCDTEEADLLCGKYLCRNKHVKHICRYCHCPTSNADDPRAKYRMKTQAEIQNLVEKKQKGAIATNQSAIYPKCMVCGPISPCKRKRYSWCLSIREASCNPAWTLQVHQEYLLQVLWQDLQAC